MIKKVISTEQIPIKIWTDDMGVGLKLPEYEELKIIV